MANSEIRIFYSWQSDLPSNETRGLIQDGIAAAVKMLRDTVEIEADRDTKGEYGSPDIVQTIFSKIDECDIFIADVSVVNKYHSVNDEGEVEEPVKLGPNPNVMLELGYAASVVGWDNVICVIDTDYGSPDDLPFDLAHRRLTPYSLKDMSKADVRKYIRDIISDTVSNLLENGPRVKSQFSNIVIGSFVPENDDISKNLVPYSPAEHYATDIRTRIIDECKGLIESINGIHVGSCEIEECDDLQEKPTDIHAAIMKSQLFNGQSQQVTVGQEEKQIILDFVKEHPEIFIAEDFFELGNLKKKVSFQIAGSGTIYEGSKEEKTKYDEINELSYRLTQMEAMEMYVKTFDGYFLFPLAIRNLSTIMDNEISVSLIVAGDARTVSPSKRIINPDLEGIEGLIYEEDIIKQFLFMSESSSIKYDTDISYDITDNINQFKAYGINGANYDEEDYERELSKYIASPTGSADNEYEFYIKSLRPKEACWLGPMIMVGADVENVEIRYSIKSNKSDGNLSGVLNSTIESRKDASQP
jgi:hypothetical protein